MCVATACASAGWRAPSAYASASSSSRWLPGTVSDTRLHLLRERAAQLLHAEAHACFDGPERFLQGSSDFLLGESAEVRQFECPALVWGQLFEGGADELLLFVQLGMGRRVIRFVAGRLGDEFFWLALSAFTAEAASARS